MSANKIAETSTSTGTGNITLAGAWSVPSSFITGNRTFNSFYGLSHRFPYMIQDQQGNWEKGIGYLSDTTTLVRETVIDNNLSTIALINFPVGDKLVMVPTDTGCDVLPKLYGNSSYAGSFFSFSSGTNPTMVANRLDMVGCLIKRPFMVSSVALNVVVSAASTKIRIGLYQLTSGDSVNYNFTRLADFGEVDSSTTGTKTLSASITLAAGFYFVATASNGTPSFVGQYNPTFDVGFSNDQTPGQGFRKTVAGSPDAMPTTVSYASTDINHNQAVPRVRFIGRFL